MAHICGWWQHRELDAIAAAENEEHHRDFERMWCDARAGKLAPIEPDHETEALQDCHWFEMLAIPAVRRVE